MLPNTTTTLSHLARRRVALTASRCFKSTSVFAPDHLATFLPRFPLKGSTTLGEVWNAVYVNYKYKMAYPLIAWGAFLWYNLWVPYKSEDAKAVEAARIKKLQDLEFRQEQLEK